MCECESRDEHYRCGRIRSSVEVFVMKMEQRDSVVGTFFFFLQEKGGLREGSFSMSHFTNGSPKCV